MRQESKGMSAILDIKVTVNEWGALMCQVGGTQVSSSKCGTLNTGYISHIGGIRGTQPLEAMVDAFQNI